MVFPLGMRDLADARWMYVKAALFLVIGAGSAALLILEAPTVRAVVLLLLAIWSFCRCYYFAFYVIERYVDSSYRFSGLFSFACYLVSRRSGHRKGAQGKEPATEAGGSPPSKA